MAIPKRKFHRTAPLLPAAWFLFLALVLSTQAREYQSHKYQGNRLTVETDDGRLVLSFRNENSLDVHFDPFVPARMMRSFVLAEGNVAIGGEVEDGPESIRFSSRGLSAVITKSPLRIKYYRGSTQLLGEADGFFLNEKMRGVRFSLEADEKLLGGGERVMGMDRRGYRLPLYNSPDGEYTTHSERMNYSLPGVLSSRKYLVMFDNAAKGWLDLGRTDPGILSFEAVGGRLSYLVVAGDTYPDIIASYVDVSGRQPMPPRWALGYLASRFGYHTEKEARETIEKFDQAGLPVDAIIFDLYWFGKDVKGHMGNLEWDREAFPEPEQMMADFQAKGIKTVLITEPFVLTTSSKWKEAVAHRALATDGKGQPFTFDFYFGNTGLVDIFDEKAREWFWTIYRGLMEEGVEGWWCDLAEPEMHPSGAVHVIGTADEVHNAYGHEWAGMIYRNQVKDFPGTRPFILMRAGFAGSQRYGLIPWTGDVKRDWGGLKAQVELSLQMGLMGLAYTHSDLGGFAGREFDKEMYIRWLQYGVFQPIYRPHGFEKVAPEPVFHGEEVRRIVGRYINLRYQLMPYLYTLAHINSTTGLPLMRPLFFGDENNPALIDNKDSYFWGDAFLVTPVTDRGVTQVRLKLPEGVWFDFWSEDKYAGGQPQTVPVDLETIPVLVKAGSFVPMVELARNAEHYTSEQLILHYYHDPSVVSASGQMYEDDGKTLGAYDQGLFELLRFALESDVSGLKFTLKREPGAAGYEGMPETRHVRLVVHNVRSPALAEASRLVSGPSEDAGQSEKVPVTVWHEASTRTLNLGFEWNHQPLTIRIAE